MNTVQQTQGDLVDQTVVAKPLEAVDKLVLPGIDVLHTKPTSIIGEVLANTLKSRPNVISFNYVIGEYIEVTYRPV